ncbi:MAG: alpha/beta fold hydrolase [Planctomycetes bacterium]|nr:alpha/beta fold hydrolase [Planctomycetota bacterium]
MHPEPVRLELHPAPDHRVVADRLPGTRPAFVWLHGLCSVRGGEKSHALFELAARLGREAWRFDFRGHGESSQALRDTTLSDLLDDANAVLAQAGRSWLVGSSLGGLVAAWIAARQPQSVEGLVLLAPALQFLPRMRAMARNDGRITLAHATGLIEFGPRMHDDLAGFDERELAAAIAAPTFIAHGESDDSVPLAASEDFVARLAAGRRRLLVVPHGDHRLNREIAAILAAAGEFHGW